MSWGSFDFQWFGDDIADSVDEATQEGLLEVALDLQQKSMDEVPVDTHKLQESCYVDDSKLNDLVVEVGYDKNGELKYALKQHEDLSLNHPNGGKAKFLEDPFNQNAEKYVEHIGKRIHTVISKESFAK